MTSGIWSFDGTEKVSGHVVEPARYRQLFEAFDTMSRVIPRGAGLSYCNASAGNRVLSISSRYFNRVRAFDPISGSIEVECGMNVGSLVAFVLDAGWTLPVIPGHPSITVGGCIGFNVHGKSQRDCGNFIGCVESLSLYHPEHGHLSCSRNENRELFEITLGGFGLTGFVVSARLRLKRLQGHSLTRLSMPVSDMHHAVRLMENADLSASIFSWHDLSSSRSRFGRGVVYSDSLDEAEIDWHGPFRELNAESRRRFPICLHSRVTTPLANRGYQWLTRIKGRKERLSLRAGLFPIAGREVYYRLFGRRGLREYQALVPRMEWDGFADELRVLLRKHRVSPTLASLKLFRGQTSLLNFCGNGVCIAIDVPATHASLALFSDLDRIVAAAAGIANLSKDSRLSKNTVRQMYPDYEEFSARIREFDPKRRFGSSLGDRILD